MGEEITFHGADQEEVGACGRSLAELSDAQRARGLYVKPECSEILTSFLCSGENVPWRMTFLINFNVRSEPTPPAASLT